MFYNLSNKTGFLFNKIRNEKKKATKKNKTIAVDNQNATPEKALTAEEENDLVVYFRSCVAVKDMSNLKIKLRESVVFRDYLVAQMDINFPELFAFFFSNPELVRL
jgi:hypothetical protein